MRFKDHPCCRVAHSRAAKSRENFCRDPSILWNLSISLFASSEILHFPSFLPCRARLLISSQPIVFLLSFFLLLLFFSSHPILCHTITPHKQRLKSTSVRSILSHLLSACPSRLPASSPAASSTPRISSYCSLDNPAGLWLSPLDCLSPVPCRIGASAVRTRSRFSLSDSVVSKKGNTPFRFFFLLAAFLRI